MKFVNATAKITNYTLDVTVEELNVLYKVLSQNEDDEIYITDSPEVEEKLLQDIATILRMHNGGGGTNEGGKLADAVVDN